jgi:hypothetical protein
MKFLTLLSGLLAVSAPCWAVPIDYTFNLTTPAGPGATLLVSSLEDAAVQIQLSAAVGTVEIDAVGAGVLSGVGDLLDIEGGDRLIFTPPGLRWSIYVRIGHLWQRGHWRRQQRR